MNRTIWKYRIGSSHRRDTELNLKAGSKLLHMQVQSRQISAWFEMNQDTEEREKRRFVAFHTGINFDNDNLEFVQTVVMSDSYVVHIYEYKDQFISEKDMLI